MCIYPHCTADSEEISTIRMRNTRPVYEEIHS